jgi:hypothetical protein
MQNLVDDRMYRHADILGNCKATPPPIDPIIPVSLSTWWKGIKVGRFPKGIKISSRVTAWRGSDLRRVIEGKNVA